MNCAIAVLVGAVLGFIGGLIAAPMLFWYFNRILQAVEAVDTDERVRAHQGRDRQDRGSPSYE